MSFILLLTCVSLEPSIPLTSITPAFSHATRFLLQCQALYNVTPSFDPFDSVPDRLRVGF